MSEGLDINSKIKSRLISFLILDFVIVSLILLSARILLINSENYSSYKNFAIFIVICGLLSLAVYPLYSIRKFNRGRDIFLRKKRHLLYGFKKRITELKMEREILSHLLYSINEAIVEISNRGEILFANKSFKKIFDVKDYKNRFYWEFIRDNTLCSMIKKSITKKENRQREVKISNKSFICSSYYLSNLKSAILICYDITPFKKLEQFKTDLVANVSHELNTPLTAILGFVDYLIDDESDESKREYLTIIKNNTTRLINIVKDLLNLSKLELNREKIELEKIDIHTLIKSIKTIFMEPLRNRELTLDIESSINKTVVMGNHGMLEELFINLIDNAIKYSEKGGIKILINNSNDNEIEILVKDSGIGIEKSKLNRVFERFYVVDKARSKKSGGTGLGLSIAKHIVLLHRGSISVESEVNVGTTFRILLPIN